MKFSRSLLIWATLAVCAAMVLGAMAWLTRDVLAAERERQTAEARADLEERTRLALWRMDAAGAAVILRENGHSPDDYNFVSKKFVPEGEPEVLLHFGFTQSRELSSPELNNFVLANDNTMQSRKASRAGLFQKLKLSLDAHSLPWEDFARFNRKEDDGARSWDTQSSDSTLRMLDNSIQRKSRPLNDLRKDSAYQANSNNNEWSQRTKAVAQTMEVAKSLAESKTIAPAVAGSQVRLSSESRTLSDFSPLRPMWLGKELVLLRDVGWNVSTSSGPSPNGRKDRSLQGVWLDAEKLQSMLLQEIVDLLPDAGLVPVQRTSEDPLSLASFPLRLERNEVIANLSPRLNGPLIVGWTAVIIALLTATLLVHGVMRLSERRASFVSAVTHELRTPLTTFRLYSDMLESGAVKPEKRGDYLRVLSREADRLSHLVENVLSFSKVERGSARSVVRETTVCNLLEPMRERLEARLATAGLTLRMDINNDPKFRVDSAAVEHILFNLIDNAAKYATTGEPPIVEISAKPVGKQLEILVRDHGPGIPTREHRRIFRAFHKSAREAAESRPGVGLGLALSRRLAKSLGGSLECIDSARGAAFSLRLPLS